MNIESTVPILSVNDLQASIRYYTDVLGFQLDWGHPARGATFASVSRDGRAIMLSERSQGSAGTWLWIGIDGDLDAMCRQFESKGAKIMERPTNYSWAYEMRVQDPDGHVLRFGSEPKSDQPFATR